MLICGFRQLWINISSGWLRLPMGLDVGLFSLCGCKGFGDLIVASTLEVHGWLQNLGFFFFGDIFWFFPAMMLQQFGIFSDTEYDAGQPEQN